LKCTTRWFGILDSSILTATDPQAAQLPSIKANVLVVPGADATEAASGDVSVSARSGG
jgi:hypothetical protein